MIPVVVESPFKGNEWHDTTRNQVYLELCLRDCIERGETPYASHKMLTVCLNDRVASERARGIEAGLVWRRLAASRIFYVDYGWSDGMQKARALYDAEGLPYETREIGAARMRELGEAMGVPVVDEDSATAETLRPPPQCNSRFGGLRCERTRHADGKHTGVASNRGRFHWTDETADKPREPMQTLDEADMRFLEQESIGDADAYRREVDGVDDEGEVQR